MTGFLMEGNLRPVLRNAGNRKDYGGRRWPNELGLDLYRIDLSGMMNKYIGETEKHFPSV